MNDQPSNSGAAIVYLLIALGIVAFGVALIMAGGATR